MSMSWHDLLFAHWPVAKEELRPLIPPELEIDTFEGSAWLGLVPFHMTNVRLSRLPKIFGMSFPELNVRTYVRHGDERGVWFFSLDAQHWLSVRVARRWYGLSYYDSQIEITQRDESDGLLPLPVGEGRGEGLPKGNRRRTINYHSCRTHRGAWPAEFAVEYGPRGEPFHAVPGTLDHFLLERYSLFAANRRGQATIAHIDHPPWSLYHADAEISCNTMTTPLSIHLPSTPPILHFSYGVKAVAESVRVLS